MFKSFGYVMSINRHQKMNVIHIKKENYYNHFQIDQSDMRLHFKLLNPKVIIEF